MKVHVDSTMIEIAESHTSSKGSCSGDKNFDEYLEYIMHRNALVRPTTWEEGLQLYFKLIDLVH